MSLIHTVVDALPYILASHTTIATFAATVSFFAFCRNRLLPASDLLPVHEGYLQPRYRLPDLASWSDTLRWLPADAFHQSFLFQTGHQLFKITLGDVLPIRYTLYRHRFFFTDIQPDRSSLVDRICPSLIISCCLPSGSFLWSFRFPSNLLGYDPLSI